MSNVANTQSNGGATPMPRQSAGAAPWSFDPFDLFSNFSSGLMPSWARGLEITRTDSGYSVELPVAGYAPDQIEVTYQDGALTVSGRNARRTFTRTLVVPDDTDPDSTSARVEHGLLTIELRKRPEAQPKKISIQVGS